MSRSLRLLVLVVLIASGISIPIPALANSSSDSATEPYIVSFEPGTSDSHGLAQSLGRSHGFRVDHSFGTVMKGFSARLTKQQVATLQSFSQVVKVEPDLPAHVADSQTIPTGVSRIGTATNGVANIDGGGSALNIDVATLDTGIDPGHPDLNVVGGHSCMPGVDDDERDDQDNWADDSIDSHGTHVAGTIGALDNGTGVVGVAPGARLWSVKVFDSTGNGLVSSVICGMDWVAQQSSVIEAVNFSGTWSGTNTGNCGATWWATTDSAHEAVCNLVNIQKIPFIVAAGNDGTNAWRTLPAAYPETITVGAIADSDGLPGGNGPSTGWGQDDTRAGFSNYGSVVTIFAPGVGILSTVRGGGYGKLSGTSMATPHVTGAVALYLLQNPTATPAEVKVALVSKGEKGTWGAWSGNQPLVNVSNNVFGGSAPQQIWESTLTVSATGSHTMTGQVTVVGNGGVVNDAIVSLRIHGGSWWSGITDTDIDVTTQANGTATINVTLPSAGFYSVSVTNIAHGSDIYVASKNVVQSRSVYIS